MRLEKQNPRAHPGSTNLSSYFALLAESASNETFSEKSREEK